LYALKVCNKRLFKNERRNGPVDTEQIAYFPGEAQALNEYLAMLYIAEEKDEYEQERDDAA